jgi:hypothetical protein
MPLRDHFHSPWSEENYWQGFHSAWANTMVRHLNLSLLPARYRAVPQVYLGATVETDVAAFEKNGSHPGSSPKDSGTEGGVATAVWAPPRPMQSVAVTFPEQDVCEIRVFDEERGMKLVGAVELVSPANKDRPEQRRAFVGKCAGYLIQQVGVVIVDVVSERRANFHAELLDFLAVDLAEAFTAEMYAASYRTWRENAHWQQETWPSELELGQILPKLPLWLAGENPIPLDLESTYEETCKVLRIST